MRTICTLFPLVFLLLAGIGPVLSQVSVNNNGNPPDGSAMLEVQSTGKGLLVPRIDFQNKPVNPAAGLVVYVMNHGPFGNGLYLYDGTVWRRVGTSTYYLGQKTGGGTVFYVDPTGRHGLVAAPVDQGWFYWGCDSVVIGPGAQYSAVMTGDLNTAAIVAACSEVNVAARACKELNTGGFKDWFLPSVDELDSMLVHRDTIGGFDPNWYYWSSTESDFANAYCVINDPYWIQYPFFVQKHYNIKVRCVRKL